MTLYTRKVEGVAPTGTPIVVDFTEIASELGPLWVSFDYWVHTADVGAPGVGIIGELAWLDPTGNVVTEAGTGIPVDDTASHNQNRKVFAVVRQGETTRFDFTLTTFGGATASGLVSYVVMLQKDQSNIDW